MRITGAIFDLDGTLLDSMGMWDTIGITVLQDLGVEPDAELTKIIDPMPIEESAAYMVETYNLNITPEEVLKRMDELVLKTYTSTIEMKEGVPEFIKALHSKGVPMVVATVTEKEMAKAALANHDMLDYFVDVVTVGDVGKMKDQPDIYDLALEKLGTEKDTTYVFEDSNLAINTVANANYKVVAVRDDSYSDFWAQMEEQANHVIDDYTDLLKHFKFEN